MTLQKRISAFDELTGAKRQTKTSFKLDELVRDVVDNHSAEFERHGIRAELDLEPMTIRAVKGMVIQILENLLSNSAYWLKTQSSVDPGFEPVIIIELDREVKTLSVFDNGPGVQFERREVTFQPYNSAKPAAQRKGLGLTISRDLACYHGWSLQMDDEVGRYRKGRLNGFVLDMDG